VGAVTEKVKAQSGSWAETLIGKAKVQDAADCGDVDVEKEGLHALCVDCREGFRMRKLGMSAREAKTEGLKDELARQKEEEKEDKFPWSLRKAIDSLFDLELEAQEGIWLVDDDDDRRAVCAGIRPVLLANSQLLELYKKVTGFEFRTRREVLNELTIREG